jgi:1-acyl-sn-glycerol-3-phosphate acyltransferase
MWLLKQGWRVARQMLAVWKLLRMLLLVLRGLGTIVLRFPKLSQVEKEQAVMTWSLDMLACIAVQLVVNGAPHAPAPVLLFANHTSWLDILVVHATRYCRFVAKADLKAWPVLGTLIAAGGTLFIARENRRDAMRVVHHMAESLRMGDVVAVFPEGTTGDGTALLPFHANLTQAAIAAQVSIQPMALRFVDAATGAHSTAPAYVGAVTLLQSVWRTLVAPPLAVVVTLGLPQTADGRDRRAWTMALRADIERLQETPPA